MKSNSLAYSNYRYTDVVREPAFGHKKLIKNLILYDAPAGSGKTFALSKIAVKLANAGQRVLFVQPTAALITETMEKLDPISHAARVIRIDQETHDDVVHSIMKHMQNPGSNGQIVFITHAAHERLPYVHRMDTWNLIIDEVLQPCRSAPLRFKHTHDALTSLLKTVPVDEIWSELLVADPSGVAELAAKAKFDDGLKQFDEALNFLRSPHWAVYVHSASYNSLLIGNGGGKFAPMLFASLKPSICAGYKSVRIAGAHISESLLAKSWKDQGVDFCSEALDDLRYIDHANGGRVKIYYGIKQDWSKTLRNKYKSEVWQTLIQKSEAIANGNDVLFLANKDTKNPFSRNIKAIRLPNAPHGLNQYTDVNNVVFLSALNPHPQHYAFLKFMGMNPDEIRRDVYYSKAYQAIMRGGIRDPHGTALQTIVVPDQALAEWLQTVFQGSTVEWLGIELPKDARRQRGRQRIHANNSEKSKAYRDSLAGSEYVSLYEDLLNLVSSDTDECVSKINKPCYETLYIKENNVNRFHATLWENVKSKIHTGYIISNDTNSFVECLKIFHSQNFNDKKDNSLFGVGLAAPNNFNMRGKKNIICARGVMLDNDGGGITPDEFAKAMAGLEIFVFNTFSSTPDDPRWRAYIPTTTVMPGICYGKIVSRIFAFLDDSGFANHGFDTGKKSAADLMYLPCQAAHPKGSFFFEYRGPTRAPLDPMSWINFDETPEVILDLVRKSASEPRDRGPRIEADFEEDILRWRTEGDIASKRNSGWTTLFFALLAKGMRIDRIREVMTAEASLCPHARDRDARINQLDRLIRGGRR